MNARQSIDALAARSVVPTGKRQAAVREPTRRSCAVWSWAPTYGHRCSATRHAATDCNELPGDDEAEIIDGHGLSLAAQDANLDRLPAGQRRRGAYLPAAQCG